MKDYIFVTVLCVFVALCAAGMHYTARAPVTRCAQPTVEQQWQSINNQLKALGDAIRGDPRFGAPN